MKYLVATFETQGKPRDFCFATKDEVVYFPFVCDTEIKFGTCGCSRCMAGVQSHKSTTTVKVVDDKKMTKAELTKLIGDAMIACGWYMSRRKKAFKEQMIWQISAISRACRPYAAGDICEVNGSQLVLRKKAS